MKRTGRRVYLSGAVSSATADAIATDGGDVAYFQNILVDERRGYAYKVTFISSFPNAATPTGSGNIPFALQSFSRRELLRMSNAELILACGRNTAVSTSGFIASQNRTIGIYGNPNEKGFADTNFQNQYVVKGDAMVTQSLNLCVDMEDRGPTGSKATYYIELDEYEVSSDEEILLILSERSGNAAGLAN